MIFQKPDMILEVFGKETGELILVLLKHDKKVSISFVTDTMRPAAERWIDKGLIDTVGEPPNHIPRFTRSTHPDFMQNLHDHLLLTTGSFVIKLTK